MRSLFAVAVVLGAMGGCSSFRESAAADDAGHASDADAGADGALSNGVPPDATAFVDGGVVEGVPPGGKLVFVSTTRSAPPGPTASFVGFADVACNMEATAAGRAGTFVAWIATTAQRAVGRLPTDKTWYLRTGVKVGDFTIFDNGAIPVAIDHDATGRALSGNEHAVWTGTLIGGDTAPDTCGDWRLSVGSGAVGDYSLAGAKWSSNGGRNCAQEAAFYCFEK
jgi:hypothetical protein